MRRIFLSAPEIAGREEAYVAQVFADNYVAPAGHMLTQFERDMAQYTGIKHAVAVSSGTAALHLSLLIADVSQGDEVWVCSKTFMGGVSPIAYQNAVPVFFDIDRYSWTIDCGLLEEELEKASENKCLPKAIVTTDLYGQSCDLDRVVELGNTYGVKVISDSAEALGAFRAEKHAGKGAWATIISFNGNKIITTSGGGMLLSDDQALIDRARKLSTQAREPFPHYEHVEIGYNYRMSNVCAAIGVGQLEQIEKKVARRREIFANYKTAFSEIDGVGFMPEPADCRSTRWLSCITVDPEKISKSPNEILDICEQEEIEVRPLWKPMHLQPVFAGTRFIGSGFCEDLFKTGLCLPSGSGMPDTDQQRVIEILSKALRS